MKKFDLIDEIGKFPRLSFLLAPKLFRWISPFNAHLKARLLHWEMNKASFEVKCHRGVRNHLGGMHAGALFTLGESCAGFVILKTLGLGQYRPILVDGAIQYHRQVRKKAVGVATLEPLTLQEAQKGLAQGEPQLLEMVTEISNENGEPAATVTTTWQIKSWDQVRKKSRS